MVISRNNIPFSATVIVRSIRYYPSTRLMDVEIKTGSDDYVTITDIDVNDLIYNMASKAGYLAVTKALMAQGAESLLAIKGLSLNVVPNDVSDEEVALAAPQG